MRHLIQQRQNTFFLFTITTFTLLNVISCKGQLQQEKKAPIQANTNSSSVLDDSLKAIVSTIDSITVNQYKEGKKEGLWRTFHANGQLKSEGKYKANLKEGVHKEWSDNGILFLEGFYAEGKENGLMKWYHEKGHLAGEGNMQDGIRVGPWKICDIEENGFCIEAHFKHGKRDGVWKINHEHARDKLWKEQTFKEDKMISERCWDEEGNRIECE